MVSIVPLLGDAYRPPVDAISHAALVAAGRQAEESLHHLYSVSITYKQVIARRSAEFKELALLVTRINAIATCCRFDERSLRNLHSLVVKIRGGKKAKPADAQKPTRKYKTSQRSFTMMASNFSTLVSVVAANPLYQANEPELQREALVAFASQLQRTNEQVIEVDNRVKQARENRDRLLYTNPDSLYALSRMLKAYVKVAFGPSHGMVKKICGIYIKKK